MSNHVKSDENEAPTLPSVPAPPCRYTNWPPHLAQLMLIALALLIGFGLLLDYPELTKLATSAESQADRGDIALYRTVVNRMRAGESFYAATGDEQHLRGYATKPFLSWRLPTLAWLIATLGELPMANILRALAGLAMLAWIQALRDQGFQRRGTIFGVLLVYSSLVIDMPPTTVFLHEAWAATLIALSLALWQRFWRLSILFGIAALAFRELTLPYVLAMAVCAGWEGRWREVMGWILGASLFLIGIIWHASIVNPLIQPHALQGGSWLALGGWTFVLSANQLNIIILALGQWLTAFWVPLALLGAGSSAGPLGNRLLLIVGGYSFAFLFVGRPDNNYWGIIYGPLIAVSLTFMPNGLSALWSAARWSLWSQRSIS